MDEMEKTTVPEAGEGEQKQNNAFVFGKELDLSGADIFQEPPVPVKPQPEQSPAPAQPQENKTQNAVRKKRRKRNVRSIIAAVLIVAICFAAVGTVLFLAKRNREKTVAEEITPAQAVEEAQPVRSENDAAAVPRSRSKGFPVSFSSNAIRSIAAVGANIYVLTDETLSLVTPSGAHQSMKVIGYVEPVIRAAGKYGLVFDRLSGKYLLFSGEKILLEGQSDDKQQILAADVCADGSFAIASKGTQGASLLTYYAKNGEPLFRWSCAQDHIVALQVAENRRDIVTAALNAENGEIVTKLFLHDIYEDQTQWEYTLSGTAAIDCFFVSSNKIVAVCDDQRVLIDTKRGKPKPNVYTYPETLLNVDSEEGNTVIVTPKFGSFDAYEVRLLTGSNKEDYVFETNARVIDVVCSGKRAYLLTENAVLAVSPSGKGSLVAPIGGVELGLEVLGGHVYHYALGYLFKN